jgi:hypothetical protein
MASTRLLVPASIAVVVVLLLTLLLGGPDALAGAAIGLVLVVLFLLSGRLPIMVEEQFGAGIAYLVLATNFIFRVVLVLVAYLVLRDASWLDAKVLGVMVIAGALAWNVLMLRKHLTERVTPVSQPTDGPTDEPTDGPVDEVTGQPADGSAEPVESGR